MNLKLSQRLPRYLFDLVGANRSFSHVLEGGWRGGGGIARTNRRVQKEETDFNKETRCHDTTGPRRKRFVAWFQSTNTPAEVMTRAQQSYASPLDHQHLPGVNDGEGCFLMPRNLSSCFSQNAYSPREQQSPVVYLIYQSKEGSRGSSN